MGKLETDTDHDNFGFRAKFLHYYSAYLSGEKKRLDNMQDTPLTPAGSAESGPQQAKYLKHLKAELQKLHENKVPQ